MFKVTRAGMVLAMAAALIIAAAVPALGGPRNPLVGSWENTDVFDGSHQRVSIGGGPGHFRYLDEASTACDDAGFGFVPAFVSGFGEFGPSTFTFTSDAYCLVRGAGGRALLAEVTLTFFYDSDADTLTDSAGQGCWYRSGSPAACGG